MRLLFCLIQWNRENNARYKNTLAGQTYSMESLESVMNAVAHGKVDEAALYDYEAGYEEILDQAWLDELRKNLMEWRPWAGDLLDAYLEGEVSICSGMLAKKYGVSLQTTRKYVRQFEQRLKSFLEGCMEPNKDNRNDSLCNGSPSFNCLLHHCRWLLAVNPRGFSGGGTCSAECVNGRDQK